MESELRKQVATITHQGYERCSDPNCKFNKWADEVLTLCREAAKDAIGRTQKHACALGVGVQYDDAFEELDKALR